MHQARYTGTIATILALGLSVGSGQAMTLANDIGSNLPIVEVQATSPVPAPRPTSTQAPAPEVTVQAQSTSGITSPQPRARPQSTAPVAAAPVDTIVASAPTNLATNRPRPRPDTLSADAARLSAAQTAASIAAATAARVQVQADAPHAAPVNSAQSTLSHRLDMTDMALIGVFGLSDNRRALLRLATGDFVRLAQGGVIDGWRVIAIGDTSIRLLRGGETKVLNIPG